MLPSPGRANSDSAADVSTSGSGDFSSAFGSGGGTSMPRPSATASRQLVGNVGEHRDDALAHRRHLHACVSSKRNARTMCAFSTGVWLFQNSVAWV